MIFSPPYRLLGGDLSHHLHPAHLADLRESGLSDKTIQAGGVYSLAPRFIDHFFRQGKVPSGVTSGLCFPYQDQTFARLKLFPPLGKMKYAQPPGTSARLYMPLPIKDGPLYVPEGEKKTLGAYQHGLNAVGIGGVWNWISKGEPIDDLSLINWDREAIIVPDSDVWERPDLLRPIYALGRELRNQGASVQVAQIPHGNAKVGFDDYLLSGGDVEELETLTLGQRTFRSCQFWYGQWKTRKAVAA